MGENQDISKIIGIIMENPDIIEKIKGLANKDDKATSNESEPTSAAAKSIDAVNEKNDVMSAASVTYDRTQSKKKRRELLYALKPYVKGERAKAIDTMLSVIDIIDVMKER